MQKAWFYDESIQTGTDFTDIGKVEAYDVKMSKFRNYRQEAELICTLLDIKTGDTLLDIGTGTGHFAVEASKRCKKVYAVDVSKTMLDYAQSKAKKENITNIEWINCGFLAMSACSLQFDHIVSNAALHHLPDFWKALALDNVYRLLKPQGTFILGDVIFSCTIDEIHSKIDSWIDNSGKIDSEFYSEAVTHIKKEYSTFSWIIEGMLERAGFVYRAINDQNNFMVYLCSKR